MQLSGFGSSFTGQLSGLQTGRVRQVTAISFSELGGGRDIHGPSISVSGVPDHGMPGVYADPGRPMSSSDMYSDFSRQLRDVLTQEATRLGQSLRQVIEAVSGTALPQDMTLDQIKASELWEGMPEAVKEGVTAYETALASAGEALRLDAARRSAAEGDQRRAEFDGLVDRAVADQVDAKLMILRAAKLMEAEISLAKLALFDTGDGKMVERMRAVAQGATEVELLNLRSDMIKDMKSDIDRGKLVVTGTQTLVWAHEAFTVKQGTADNLSVFVETRDHVAAASLSVHATGSAVSLRV
ncbi:hypothetical protein [uncultured Roseobacter sp.]|uniref:hypothetical protein n=1 Tax=uncultured Roseobacter sp. TaxID=114847 RepID=UPI002605182D|nr:hypothetical protein [uncultured Roseobacter sp.]